VRSRLQETGKPFKFTAENLKKAKDTVKKYPEGRQASAVKSLLYMAQEQNGGWVSREAIETIAEFLEMPLLQVWEVASFYTMFQLQPVGKNLIQVCRTTPCWLRGSDEVLKACKKHTGADVGEVSKDGLFTTVEVECLGACANAPMIQINNTYYEDLDEKSMTAIIQDIKDGKTLTTGSQINRQGAAPEGGPQTLNTIENNT